MRNLKTCIALLTVTLVASGCGASDTGSSSDNAGVLDPCVESFNDAIDDTDSPVGAMWSEGVVNYLDGSDVTGSVARQDDTCFTSISVQNGGEGVRMIFKGEVDGDWSIENTSAGSGPATGISSENVDEVEDADVDESGISL